MGKMDAKERGKEVKVVVISSGEEEKSRVGLIEEWREEKR